MKESREIPQQKVSNIQNNEEHNLGDFTRDHHVFSIHRQAGTELGYLLKKMLQAGTCNHQCMLQFERLVIKETRVVTFVI